MHRTIATDDWLFRYDSISAGVSTLQQFIRGALSEASVRSQRTLRFDFLLDPMKTAAKKKLSTCSAGYYRVTPTSICFTFLPFLKVVGILPVFVGAINDPATVVIPHHHAVKLGVFRVWNQYIQPQTGMPATTGNLTIGISTDTPSGTLTLQGIDAGNVSLQVTSAANAFNAGIFNVRLQEESVTEGFSTWIASNAQHAQVPSLARPTFSSTDQSLPHRPAVRT